MGIFLHFILLVTSGCVFMLECILVAVSFELGLPTNFLSLFLFPVVNFVV